MTADPPHWREVRDRLTAKRDSPTPEPQQRPPAPMTIEQVEAIVSVLDRHKVDYVMIGGIAAELHGAKIARSLDLDVTPAASRANRERIARALAELNATLRVPGGMPDGVEVHIDADWLERVTTATFNTDHGPFDLAFRPDGTDGYDDLVRSVVIVRVGAVDARLASLEDIVRSKTAAGRTKDELTLPALIERLKAIRADQDRPKQTPES